MSILRRYLAHRAERREELRKRALMVSVMAELMDIAADGLLAPGATSPR